MANAVGTSRQNIEGLETAGDRKPKYLAELAKVMGTTADQLLKGRSVPIESNGSTESSNVAHLAAKAKVPLISWVQAGELADVQDIFHPGDAIKWTEAYYSRPSKSAYALQVDGDSMTSQFPGAQSFPDGTIIIVDPDAGYQPGDYVIAKDVATQKATFKQLMSDGSRWYLKPINQTYPTIEIDDPALRVIGKVIEFQPPGGKL